MSIRKSRESGKGKREWALPHPTLSCSVQRATCSETRGSGEQGAGPDGWGRNNGKREAGRGKRPHNTSPFVQRTASSVGSDKTVLHPALCIRFSLPLLPLLPLMPLMPRMPPLPLCPSAPLRFSSSINTSLQTPSRTLDQLKKKLQQLT